MSITIPLSAEDTKKVSDGYHTFEELYEHRVVIYIKLVKLAQQLGHKAAWKPHYPGWPVLFLETPAGQISYHFPEKFLPTVDGFIPRDDNHVWDGHESLDVISRLLSSWNPEDYEARK